MDGIYIPPSLIYQAMTGNIQNTQLNNFKSNKVDTAYFTNSPLGQMNNKLRIIQLITIFNHYIKAKARHRRDWRLFFINKYSSHINIPFLDWYLKYKILVAIYPPIQLINFSLQMLVFLTLQQTTTPKSLINRSIIQQGFTILQKKSFTAYFKLPSNMPL